MIKFRRKNITSSHIFILAWIIMLIHICVANSSYSSYSLKYVSYIGLIIIFLKIIITKYTKREMILSFFILAFSIISSYKTSDMRTVWFALFLVGAKNVNFDKIVKATFYTMLSCCTIFIIFSLFGIVSITSVSSVKGIRYSFGLGHPNMASAYYSIIISLFCYLRKDKIKIWNLLTFWGLGIGVYLLTKSMTGLVICSFYVILMLLFKSGVLKIKFIKYLIFITLVLVIAFFTIAPITYNSNLSKINEMLTGRISQSNYYINKYGVNLWGNNVFKDLNSKTTDNILDDGYIRILMVNGLVSYIFVLYGYIKILNATLRIENYNLFNLICFFILYLCVENVATYIFMNVTFLLFKTIIFKEDESEYT